MSWCGSMAEQLICNQQVDGSTPFTSSSYLIGNGCDTAAAKAAENKIWERSRVAKGDRL